MRGRPRGFPGLGQGAQRHCLAAPCTSPWMPQFPQISQQTLAPGCRTDVNSPSSYCLLSVATCLLLSVSPRAREVCLYASDCHGGSHLCFSSPENVCTTEGCPRDAGQPLPPHSTWTMRSEGQQGRTGSSFWCCLLCCVWGFSRWACQPHTAVAALGSGVTLPT